MTLRHSSVISRPRVAAALVALSLLSVGVAASPASPYRIGYLVDASGSEQQTIKPSLDGLNLYIAELNRSGGVKGRPVEIVVRDTRSDLQQSLDAVVSLSNDGVLGIAGMGVSSTHGPVLGTAPSTLPTGKQKAADLATGRFCFGIRPLRSIV